MSKYTKYKLYQKYETRGSQEAIPCYPNVFSIDGDGTMPLVIVEENSRDCGYTGETQPIYRWYTLPIDTYYYCDACQDAQYKWVNLPIAEDWECVGTTKYYKQKKMVSVDGGSTWTDVTPPQYQRGALYEYSSQSCGYRTRTSSGSPYCTGYDKYVDVYSQYSTDGGNTWQTTATTPTMVEHNSAYCGYVPDPQYRTTSGTPYCSGYDKYVDVYSQVSYDEGVTWQTTATTPTMVEHNSSFCGYEVKYRTTSGTSYCDGYSKYVPVYSQVSYDMGTTWETTATTNILIESYSQDCGYVPLTRWVESGWTCVGYDKYVNNVQQISYDNGQTWVNTSNTSASTLIESYSTDCGVMYRWTDTDVTVCSEANKYYVAYKEMSLDGGQTWSEVIPRVTSLGTLVEAISMDCFKFYATYSDPKSRYKSCDGSTTITTGDTFQTGYVANRMTTAIIGNCVTAIGASAFTEFSSLTTVNISNNVTSIGSHAFYECRNLGNVTLPSGLTSIGDHAFGYCQSMWNVVIPASVTSIGDGAFVFCNYLDSITCLATTPPTLGNNAFMGTNDCPIYVPCDSITAYKSANVWSDYASRIEAIEGSCTTQYRWIADCWLCQGYDKWNKSKQQVSYDGGETWEDTGTVSATTLEESNSFNCGYGSSSPSSHYYYAEYSGGTRYAYDTDCDYTLSYAEANPDCYDPTKMTYAYIGGCYDTIESVFSGHTSLSSVTFGGGVREIGWGTFSGCTSLTSVTLPSTVVYVGAQAFRDCTSLQYVTVESTNPPSASTSESIYMFDNTNNCPIYVPCNSVGSYKSATGWRRYADRIYGTPPCNPYKFVSRYSNGTSYSADCNSSSALTSGETRPSGYEYTAMTSAEIGSCVKNINVNAFSGCTSLSSVTMTSGTTSINQQAFYQCTSLSSVTIPSSVTGIYAYAFYGCSSLKRVEIHATTPPTLGNAYVFENTPITNAYGYIYVPRNSVDAYKSASGWINYKNKILPLPT